MHNTNRPVISTHVLDLTRGTPAAGVPVTCSRIENGAGVAAVTKETDADGRIADLGAGEIKAGSYQLRFDVAAYFRKQGKDPAPFFTTVVLDVEITDTNRRYHIPLLVTPYSCASYRGS